MLDQIVKIVSDTVIGLVNTIIRFFPDLILASIVLLVGWIIARILRSMVQRITNKLGLDKLIDTLGFTEGLAQANIKQPPSVLLATSVYWFILLNFLLTALQRLRLGPIVEPLQQFISKLPAFAAALVTFILGMMLARLANRIVSGALAGIGLEIHQTLGNIIQYLILCVVFIIALQQIGLDVELLKNLFSTTLLILITGVALSFGLGGNSVARNALAGYYARATFKIGDTLIIDGEEAILEAIGTINAELRTANGFTTIPNSRLTEETNKKIE